MLTDTATFRATEELWQLAKMIITLVECEKGRCIDCDSLRSIAAEVLDIKKELRSD